MMNFIDRKINNYRRIISKFLLDLSEKENSKFINFLSKNKILHRVLFNLKEIRKRQRKKSLRDLEEKKIPKNVSIKLSSIICAIPLEYEDFEITKSIFKQLKVKDEKTSYTIKNILENKYFTCTNQFGIVAGENKNTIINKIKSIKSIPSNVKNIELTYTKITPSLSIIILKFNLRENVSEEINKLQTKEYLSTVTFSNFFPFNNFHYGMVENCNYRDREITIKDYNDSLKIDLKKWICDIFKLKDYKLKKYFFVDNYDVLGNPTNEEDFKLWLKENKKWLKDFKFYSKFFQNENFFTYYSQNTIINFEPYQIEKDKITNVKKINEEILGRIIYRSIYFLINYYQLELEKLKKKLFSRWILFNSSSKRLTLLIILINRLNEELKKNKQNIKDKISIIGISKNINDENIEENIADKFMKDIFFRLKEIKKDLKILDNGVTKILSIANIKTILLLTIVMLFLTSLGVFFAYKQVSTQL